MKLIIMRGLPGSGKSTYAKNHYPDALICSADDYFMKDGEYVWDRGKLRTAHVDCFSRVLEALKEKDSWAVVLDNTNTRLEDFKYYITAAHKDGHTVSVVRIVCSLDNCHDRGSHDVPRGVVASMLLNFEDFPGEELVAAEYGLVG